MVEAGEGRYVAGLYDVVSCEKEKRAQAVVGHQAFMVNNKHRAHSSLQTRFLQHACIMPLGI